MTKRRSAFGEAQRYRFNHSCLSCLVGNHDCDLRNLWRFDEDEPLMSCQCGCVIEPWPWPTGD